MIKSLESSGRAPDSSSCQPRPTALARARGAEGARPRHAIPTSLGSHAAACVPPFDGTVIPDPKRRVAGPSSQKCCNMLPMMAPPCSRLFLLSSPCCYASRPGRCGQGRCCVGFGQAPDPGCGRRSHEGILSMEEVLAPPFLARSIMVRLDSNTSMHEETKDLNQTPSAMSTLLQIGWEWLALAKAAHPVEHERRSKTTVRRVVSFLLFQRVTSSTRLTSDTLGLARSSRTGMRSRSS